MSEYLDQRPEPWDCQVQFVTEWLEALKAGNLTVATRLWNRSVGDLFRVAAKRLGHARRGVEDEEDVVLAAFHNLLRRITDGGFANLDDCDDDRDIVWQILVLLACCRAIVVVRRPTRNDHIISIDDRHSSDSDPANVNIPTIEPSTEFELAVAGELNRQLNAIGNHTARQVLSLRMEGYSNPEIARILRASQSTVDRKRRTFRQRRSQEVSV